MDDSRITDSGQVRPEAGGTGASDPYAGGQPTGGQPQQRQVNAGQPTGGQPQQRQGNAGQPSGGQPQQWQGNAGQPMGRQPQQWQGNAGQPSGGQPRQWQGNEGQAAGRGYLDDPDLVRVSPDRASYEARRAEREKRRREEMIARKKKIRIVKIAIAAAFVLFIALLAFAGIKILSGSKNPQTGGNGGGDTTVVANDKDKDQEESKAEEAAGSKEGDAGEDSQQAAAENPEEQPASEGGTYQADLEKAQLLAAGYDYDAAIELMTAYSGEAEVQQAIDGWKSARDACVAVDVHSVPHVFFHSLINDDRAFNADLVGSDRVRQNNAAMTTTVEFDAMIEDMYEAGYVMIGLDDMCIKTTDDNGVVHIAPNDHLMLPAGKKPFVLSIDDLSYYHSYGIGTQGYATKMIVDENGKPKCVYTDENGETSIGDYDVVPRIDSFIQQHPDFSYRGARGTVAMTGYNGVFGYRTNDYYKDINDPHLDPDQILWLQEHPDFDWEQDCKDAKAVADAMKAEGWTFASHTYGHLNATSSDLNRLAADHERWKTVNEPILGKTDKIIFAFGADIGNVGGYTADNPKFQYFKSEGFNIFCNVDGNIGWTEFGDTFMRTGRVALDGFTMYQAMTDSAIVHTVYANDYEQLGIHDVGSFFNSLRPTPIDSE